MKPLLEERINRSWLARRPLYLSALCSVSLLYAVFSLVTSVSALVMGLAETNSGLVFANAVLSVLYIPVTLDVWCLRYRGVVGSLLAFTAAVFLSYVLGDSHGVTEMVGPFVLVVAAVATSQKK
jgi:hypothetical protein